MYWFSKSLPDKHKIAFDLYRHLKLTQKERLENWRQMTETYLEEDVAGFSPYSLSHHNYTFLDNHVSYNVTALCIDTLVARISANDPSFKIITTEGPETLQEEAQNLEQLATGILNNTKGHHKATVALRDACLYNVGYVRPQRYKDTIKLHRIHPALVFADNFADVDPDTLYQVSYIARDNLLQQFPHKKNMINECSEYHGDTDEASLASNTNALPDIIEVLECWKKGDADNPGLYLCCIDSGVLIEQDYPYDCFPLKAIRFEEPVQGYYGKSLASRLHPIQKQIDYIAERIGVNIDLWTQPYMAISRETQLDQEDCWVENEYGRFLRYSGNTPTLVKPDGINEQVIRYLENLYQKAFEIARLSQLSATSQKPAGLDSGVALRTYNDIETRGFATLSKSYFNFVSEIGKGILICAYHIALETPKKKIKTVFKKDNEEVVAAIDLSIFKQLTDDVNTLIIRTYNTSDLPNTPGAKLQYVQEMARNGLMTPQEAREALGMPDLEKSETLANADTNYTKTVIEQIIRTKVYTRPTVFQNLPYAIDTAKAYWLNLAAIPEKSDDVETAMALLEHFAEEATQLLNKLQPPAPPPPQGPQGTPPIQQ